MKLGYLTCKVRIWHDVNKGLYQYQLVDERLIGLVREEILIPTRNQVYEPLSSCMGNIRSKLDYCALLNKLKRWHKEN